MPIQPSHISCGVHQYYMIDHIHGQLTAGYLRNLLSDGLAQATSLLFSDADQLGNGIKLAQQIRAAFPDTDLIESAPKTNPNSGSIIRTWVWTPDWEAVAKYAEEHKLASHIAIRCRQTAERQASYDKSRAAAAQPRAAATVVNVNR